VTTAGLGIGFMTVAAFLNADWLHDFRANINVTFATNLTIAPCQLAPSSADLDVRDLVMHRYENYGYLHGLITKTRSKK
jgi:hypothetical protein